MKNMSKSMSKCDAKIATCTVYYTRQCVALEACRGQSGLHFFSMQVKVHLHYMDHYGDLGRHSDLFSLLVYHGFRWMFFAFNMAFTWIRICFAHLHGFILI